MPGPIMSAGNIWLEGASLVVLIALLCVLMSPELTAMIVDRVPWLAHVFGWLHQVLDRR